MEETKDTADDGQLFPDNLRIEIKSDRQLVGCCWFVISREAIDSPGTEATQQQPHKNVVCEDFAWRKLMWATNLKCYKKQCIQMPISISSLNTTPK